MRLFSTSADSVQTENCIALHLPARIYTVINFLACDPPCTRCGFNGSCIALSLHLLRPASGSETLSRFQCGCLLLAKLLQFLEELGIGSLEKIGFSWNFQCQNVNMDRGLGMTG